MAKKSGNKTARNVIICFVVIILGFGAFYVWDNRAVDIGDFAGTLNGERMPLEHLFFFFDEAWEVLVWQQGMPEDEETANVALGIAFEWMIDLHLTVSHAAEFGIYADDIDARELQEYMDTMVMTYFEWGIDVIADFGFTEESFRQFAQMRMITDLVRIYVGNQLYVPEALLAAAFEDFIEEEIHQIGNEIIEVLANVIEVRTHRQAEDLRERILNGADFAELMHEYSVLEEISAGVTGTIGDTDFLMVHVQIIAIENEMEAGDISEIIEFPPPRESFVFFEVLEINEIRPLEEVEREYKEQYEAGRREAHFRLTLEMWRQEANVEVNTELFGYDVLDIMN